ncbi:CotH kinase family protein [Bacteroides sp. OttesenSCG-928-E20]|nr:CotH kinase family protein [Bacteroides sp. OttesenSCG-928-E20]MDL2304368.1 CotH kinase family protein [Bacteroides sp. OttesenSCG-928-D19]
MKSFFGYFFLLILSLCSPIQHISAKVWINEFMQSNIDLVRDDWQEFPDSWVELYNDGDASVDIYNWCISASKKIEKGWRFNKHLTIPPKGYLIIYCDKTGDGAHTSFRLESGKDGEIYLFDTNNNVVDQITGIAKQPEPNIAYGRVEDGSEEWAYFITATPKAPNAGPTAKKVAPKPVFSQKGGVFKSQFTLTLALPEGISADASTIYYTLDGAEPTQKSTKYNAPIAINKTTVVRAKIIADGYLIGRSLTHSYIITNRDFDLPIVSISLDPEYMWDDEFGIYVKGNGKYGVTGNCLEEKVNWNQNWRRPMNFEYFPTADGESVLNQQEEMRISGGCSRGSAQKSLILYANKRFGEKRYNYQLFNEKPGQEIKSFMIRNSGNDFWYTHFRDAAIQQFMGGKVDLDYQAYQPAILYINGEYFGIQNLRERSNEDFVVSNYDGLEDIDMMENWWEVKAGNYYGFNEKIEKGELKAEQLMEMIDVNEVINYYILQIYVRNTDFPNNNVVLWRPQEEGGKWRFIVKDTDFGLGLYGHDVKDNAFDHNTKREWGKYFFNALIAHKPFKDEFCKRFALYLGDVFHFSQTSHIIDSLQQNLKAEMPHHIERWRPHVWWRDMNGWNKEVADMRAWCSKRNGYVYQQLNSWYKFNGLTPIKIEIPEEITGITSLSVNNVNLHTRQFDGSYYKGHPFEVQCTILEDSNFKGWLVSAYKGSEVTTTEFVGSTTGYTIPNGVDRLVFSAISTITGLEANHQDADIAIYNNEIQISNLVGDNRITVHDTTGRTLQKVQTNDPTVKIPLQTKGIVMITVENDGKKKTYKVAL